MNPIAIITAAIGLIQALEPYIQPLLEKGELTNEEAEYLRASIEVLKAVQRAGGVKGPEWELSHRLGKDKLPLPALDVNVQKPI